MKGVVFTEFLEMVEDKFSVEAVDRIVQAADLPSCGAYAATGTYPPEELVSLVTCLSEDTKVAVPDLLVTYGQALFKRFSEVYGAFFEGIDDSFTFLENVEHYVHIEVRKLYPTADLPHFTYEERSDRRLVMVYRSERPFAMFAEGLIKGCIDHFGEQIEVQHQDLSGGAGTHSRFELTRSAA